MKRIAYTFAALNLAFILPASADTFDTADPKIDALVEECVDDLGVRLIGEDSDVACYNEAIFPANFLKFNALPTTRLTVITSPGGHVITARIMAAVLDQRGGRVVIADQCASACAMMLTPAIDDLHIHRTAHFAIHGITTLSAREFNIWEKDRKDRKGSNGFMSGFARGLGLSNSYYSGGGDQFEGHLKAQGIDGEYQNQIGARMLDEAEGNECLYPPGDYWGLLDADYLRSFLGDQITVMEDFVQSYDHPGFKSMRKVSKRIGSNTYVFNHTLGRGGCF